MQIVPYDCIRDALYGFEQIGLTYLTQGCVTCKAKRLKCDETKPKCQQCARRNVECGGYRKDYKWRPFGETTFVTAKPPPSTSPARLVKKDVVVEVVQDDGSNQDESPLEEKAVVRDLPERHQPVSPTEKRREIKAVRQAIQDSQSPVLAEAEGLGLSLEEFDFEIPSPEEGDLNAFAEAQHIPHDQLDPRIMPPPRAKHLSLSLADLSNGILTQDESLGLDGAIMFSTTSTTPAISPMNLTNSEFFPGSNDDVEEVIRTSFPEMDGSWSMVPVLPDFYASSMTSIGPDTLFTMQDMFSIPRGIDLGSNSPENLTLRFDRQTCGILSVKDGPTENPWRTLIWPLARDSPALYHAIASMTSFHTSKNQPEFRVQGIDHMRTSIEALASGIENMQFDTAIATTLALAFAESWDQHTSTGINHIRGAKVLVNQALNWHNKRAFSGPKLERLKFLTNAWVYMDVLARLTSSDDDESNDFDAALANPFVSNPFGDESHIDPLMGAASTLFPLVGRVANLVRKVRRTERNSPTIISQAMDLKTMLQEWDAPLVDESIEDPSVEIEHSIQTAEAYRWATLLYLHQAVPEIPSEPSAELGKKVMILLATVPLSSRTVIVHIYPLMAASCEAVDQEDRQWVHERWLSMAQRMKIGVIDRCVEVVNEVWSRRDLFEAQPSRAQPSLKRGSTLDNIDMSSGADPTFPWADPFANRKRRATSGAIDMLRDSSFNRPRKAVKSASGGIEFAYTVRGHLHWLSVMKDWAWEGTFPNSLFLSRMMLEGVPADDNTVLLG